MIITKEVYSKGTSKVQHGKAKVISKPLAMRFKLSTKQCPSNDDEKKDMKKVPYTLVVGIVSHSLSNSGREHWNVVHSLWLY